MVEDPVARGLLGMLRVPEPAEPAKPPEVPDWDGLVRLAGQVGMQGMLAARAERLGAPRKGAAATQLSLAGRRIARQHGLHAIEAARAQAALDAAGVASVVLKGVVLAGLVYETPAERSYRDVDLLVARRDFDRGLRALEGIGLREESPEAVRSAYRDHHFHAVLGGKGRPFVELHWGVTRPDDPYSLDVDALLADACTFGELRAPHPDTHVLVALVSLMRDGFSQLKPVVDIDRIVRAGLPVRWDRVARLAAEGGLGAALRAALELAHALLGTPVADALETLPPLGVSGRRLEALRLERLPFESEREDAALRARLVQLQLVANRRRWTKNFLLRKRFERAQLRASGVSGPRRAIGLAKRAAQLARIAAWQLVH